MALALVKDAVAEAGRIAMHYFDNGHDAWEKGPGQIVTAADLEIDKFLAKALPEIVSAAWLSEETEDRPDRLGAQRVWIVDPIDGTRSFAAGKPEFTISVALVEGTRPILGVVFNPARCEWFVAEKGKGASFQGAPLGLPRLVGLEGASIVVSQSENRRRKFGDWFPGAFVTEIGSLAYKLALVANARFDAYFSWRRAHDWDIAAAALLLEEAGAVLTDRAGEGIAFNQPDPRHQGLIAAVEPLHRQLLARSQQEATDA